MAPMSPETPRSLRKHGRNKSSLSDLSKIKSEGSGGKVIKNVPGNDGRRCSVTGTPVKKKATRKLRSETVSLTSHANDFPGSSSSNLSDTEMLESEQPNTQIVNGEVVVADAFEAEPAGEETPQDVKEVDDMLAKLKPAPKDSKLDSDDEQKRTQFFRRICILFDSDPENNKMEVLRAFLDTGSQYSLIFESGIRALDLQFQHFSPPRLLYSIDNRSFKVIGKRQLFFKYKGKDIPHGVDVYVLKNPHNGTEPSFDILLGREHLLAAGAISVNFDVCGPFCQVSHQAPSRLQPKHRDC